jgi:galactose mutarotase-like enzyme
LLLAAVEELPMPQTSIHTHGCRVSDEWMLRGMRAAVLENDLLRVLVLLDRGAEIVEFRYKPLDLDPLLRLPVELRDPSRGLASIAGGAGTFLDYYVGGWQEIAPNGGPTAAYKGAEYGQHGEISLLPWASTVLEDTPEQVRLRCSVRALRTPLRLERTMMLQRGRATLTLDERLTNEAGEPLDVMWGHHVAFGLPFLQDGATITTSGRRLLVHEDLAGFTPRRLVPGRETDWPFAAGQDGGTVDMSVVPARDAASGREMCYLTEFDGPAWYAISGPAHSAGFAMRWDGDLFRYLWLWQELGRASGFPWWGRTHAVALEPWTSYPTLGLPEAIRRDTQLTLQPGQTVETRLVATAYRSNGRVTGVAEDGAVLMDGLPLGAETRRLERREERPA